MNRVDRIEFTIFTKDNKGVKLMLSDPTVFTPDAREFLLKSLKKEGYYWDWKAPQ